MDGYSTNIEERTRANDDFRRVLFTGPHAQLVLMSLRPGEDIGVETHDQTDQFLRVESGRGVALIDGVEHPLYDGAAVVIPAGCEHNVLNTSDREPLRLYTLYSRPEHEDQAVHHTKQEAERAEHAH